MGNAAVPEFHFFHIPKDNASAIPHLAQKYKELRLLGLEKSPESFGSSLAVEQQYPDSIWQRHVLKNDLETFICSVSPPNSTAKIADVTSNDSTWIAQVTVRGPIDAKEFELPEASGQDFSAATASPTEERWQFLGLYVHPDYRGHHVAFRLCQEAIQWLETRIAPGSQMTQLRLRSYAAPTNKASVSLFKKLGFVDSGLCTRNEGLVAHGEEGSDPKREEYNIRAGWILLRVIQRP